MGISKYDNAFKSNVLKHEIDKKVQRIKKDYYKHDKHLTVNEDGIIDQIFCPSWEKWKKLNKVLPRIDCALRLNESKKKRVARIKDKIRNLIKEGNAIFLTLTFTDDVLEKTTDITRRRYVARYLKDQSPFYVANIDFSPEKHREHYHAIVINRVDKDKWTYGFTYCERIRNQDKDIERTSKYVAKLTSHALKVKEITPRLIYSRDTIYIKVYLLLAFLSRQ